MRDPADRESEVIVVILGGGRGARLDPLTRLRAKPAVPFAGKYRLIDIPVSNAIRSGMERIFVLTQFNSTSLHRHLTRAYKFDIFSRGFLQILAAQQTPFQERWFQGTADAVRQNLRIVADAPGDLVLVLAGDHLYRMDYRRILREHVASGADVTLGVYPCAASEIAAFGAVRVDGTGRVVEFREKPKTAEARAGMEASPELVAHHGMDPDKPFLASMGIYLFDKQRLVESLDNALVDFGHHVIPACVERFHVQSHWFGGYWRDIGTIKAFYDAHMDLVQAEPAFDFYDPHWQFYTHPRYLPGSRLTGCRIHHAILADGAIIEDSTIEHSVVGVRMRLRNATVRRSLLMGAEDLPPAGPAGAPAPGISEGTLIQNAIVDLNARIGRNVRIVNREGVQEAEGAGWAIRDGIVVVEKNAVIPDGAVI